jgi:hypothetical protein
LECTKTLLFILIGSVGNPKFKHIHSLTRGPVLQLH